MIKRIIINNDIKLNDIDALRLVMKVIEQGKISNYNKQYCYCTIFELPEYKHKKITVICSQRKKSYSFNLI